MPKETPTNEAELSIRLEIIKELITKGLQQREIVRYCKEKHPEWNLAEDGRQLRNYVYQAKAELSEEAPAIDRRREFTIAKLRNDLLFNSSVKISDYRTALAANVQNIKLMRLDDPKFKMDWRAAAEAAGLDPEETMKQFMSILENEAAQNNGNE